MTLIYLPPPPEARAGPAGYRTSDVHVGRLRRALNAGRASDPIRTVHGTGYSFDERFGREEPLSKRGWAKRPEAARQL